MTRLRLLIDDAAACLTQRAVLATYAATLAGRADTEVILTSELPQAPGWPDVPTQSSRRLAAIVAAFAALPGTCTVFLPAHTLPGDIGTPAGLPHTLASDGALAVADLDLFIVDNASPQVAAFQAHLGAAADYEAISRYDGFSAGPLPGWLTAGGLVSARRYTDRPWYSIHAPGRTRWLECVGQALDRGDLSLAQVAADVAQGDVRPSLLQEVQAVRAMPVPLAGPDLTLDALFVAPPRRLPPAQLALLHSPALQRRMLDYAERNSARKPGKAGKLVRNAGRLALVRKLVRPAWRLGWRLLHAVYAVSLRPAVRRWRAAGGARP